VDKNRRLLGIANVFQNREKLIEIVPIDGADIIKTKFLEPGATCWGVQP
jgi:hypothetical protein